VISPVSSSRNCNWSRRRTSGLSCRSLRRHPSPRLAEYGPAEPDDLPRSGVRDAAGDSLFTFVLFLRSMANFRAAGPQFGPTLVRGVPVRAGPAAGTHLHGAIGVLVGVLLTFSRMSGDGEITAMRAAGRPGMSVVCRYRLSPSSEFS